MTAVLLVLHFCLLKFEMIRFFIKSFQEWRNLLHLQNSNFSLYSQLSVNLSHLRKVVCYTNLIEQCRSKTHGCMQPVVTGRKESLKKDPKISQQDRQL